MKHSRRQAAGLRNACKRQQDALLAQRSLAQAHGVLCGVAKTAFGGWERRRVGTGAGTETAQNVCRMAGSTSAAFSA